ncbi:MAG: tetratricopeptide repeat protein [Gemmatimonadales bacterium]|nr:tetratricopeptide repeat protein [Gemmatimonadales bacterium]
MPQPPEPLHATDEPAEPPPPPALRRWLPTRWTFFAVAVAGLLVVSLWLRYSASAPPPAPPPAVRPPSIAILPLVNASPDTANEYLSDGITEQLIGALGPVPGLRVIARPSAFAYDERALDAQAIGQRLDVGAVLEGSVRQFGDRLRVNVHLVSVPEGFDIWSETYERPAADLFAVEDHIARSVVAALRLRPPAALVTQPTASFEAHTAYLQGLYHSRRFTRRGVQLAINYFGEAIRLDSTFAGAWAGLADAYIQRGIVEELRPKESMPPAKAALERSLALDSTLAEAHTTLGLIRFHYDWDWTGAEASFRRATALNPNLAEAHLWLAHLLLALGRAEESSAAGRRALSLSPADQRTRVQLGWQHLRAERYDEAREAAANALKQSPSAMEPHYQLALLAELSGDYPTAMAELELALTSAPDRAELRASLARVYALAGRPEEARRIVAELGQPSDGRYVSPYFLAWVGAALGDERQAFVELAAAAADRSEHLVYLRVDPRLDTLRQDPRFGRLAGRIGLP